MAVFNDILIEVNFDFKCFKKTKLIVVFVIYAITEQVNRSLSKLKISKQLRLVFFEILV